MKTEKCSNSNLKNYNNMLGSVNSGLNCCLEGSIVVWRSMSVVHSNNWLTKKRLYYSFLFKKTPGLHSTFVMNLSNLKCLEF